VAAGSKPISRNLAFRLLLVLPELRRGFPHGGDIGIGRGHRLPARLANQEMLFDFRHFPGGQVT
jgi:hypothetical protein